jgi:putative FmdB family regulatory protein
MPIYEYSCKKCGAHVEAMQKISDKPLARHAGCGGKLEKEWSRTGFQFKGTGWYVTDYAGKKGESKEGKESKAEARDSKSDSKDSKSDSSSTSTTASESKKPKASSASASAGGE